MRKLTALVLASSLTMGMSAAYAADTATTTTAPAAQSDTQQTMPMQHHMKRGMHHNGKMKGGPHGGMFAGLNLTEQQREQMRAISNDFRNSHHQMPGMGMGHMQEMHKFVASDTFDEAAARAQIESTNKARNDMMLDRMKMENKMYNVLTPEQKKQFAQNYEQRMKQWQDRANNAGKAQAPATN